MTGRDTTAITKGHRRDKSERGQSFTARLPTPTKRTESLIASVIRRGTRKQGRRWKRENLEKQERQSRRMQQLKSKSFGQDAAAYAVATTNPNCWAHPSTAFPSLRSCGTSRIRTAESFEQKRRTETERDTERDRDRERGENRLASGGAFKSPASNLNGLNRIRHSNAYLETFVNW